MSYLSDLLTNYPSTNDCIELEKQITKLVDLKFALTRNEDVNLPILQTFLDGKNSKYKNLNCDSKNIDVKAGMIDYYTQKYEAVDKDRISPTNDSDVRKRILVGGGILIIGFGLVLTFIQKK